MEILIFILAWLGGFLIGIQLGVSITRNNNYTIKLLKVNILTLSIDNGKGWIRILGKGFEWINVFKHILSFSQRNNYAKCIKIGKYNFYLLKK